MTQSRTNSTQNVKTQPEVEQDNYMTDRTRCGLRLKHDMVRSTTETWHGQSYKV